MDIVEIWVNCPSVDVANTISGNLIERRLVACSNLYAPIQSAYLWRGVVEHQQEHPLLLKTRAELVARVEKSVRDLHPYEVPPIVRIAIASANEDYAQWIYEMTVPL